MPVSCWLFYGVLIQLVLVHGTFDEVSKRIDRKIRDMEKSSLIFSLILCSALQKVKRAPILPKLGRTDVYQK